MKKILKITSLALLVTITFAFLKPQENRKPNILMIVMDDAGLDMSAYGRTWVNTPGFDRIAREGILFNRAYTPNAKCGPSRSSILTGRNSWQLDAAANHNIYFPTKFKSYPEALAENGYTIGLTGKGWGPGTALHDDGSPRSLLGEQFNEKTLKAPTKHISNNDYTANFQDFVTQSKDQPWCFWVGFTEPHRAYEFGTGESLGGKKKTDIEKVPNYWPDQDSIRTDMLDYAYEIEYVDSHVQKILMHLESIEELENTIIIYTSDHGMPFPRVKGNQYENANHVPFAVRWGNGIKHANRKVDDYISFIDIAPTLLTIAGLSEEASNMQPITGKSLLPIFESTKSGQIEVERDYLLVGQERHDIGRPGDVGYPIRGLHKNGYLFLKNYETARWPVCDPITGYLNCDGSPTKTYILNQRRNGDTKYYWSLNFGKREETELYNLENDPDCIENLARNTNFKNIFSQMENEMEVKLLAQGDLRMMGFGHIYEQYPVSNLKGFYESFMAGEKMTTGWVNDSDFEKETLED
jgi:N-sulfoglucosamine sulfohydrolase